jgi:small-conductance mechanosensitive channel
MDTHVVVQSLTRIMTNIIEFIPNLVNGLIILVVGYLISALIRWLLRTVLRRTGFDPLVERTGITGSLRGLGVRTPLSAIVAQGVFILLLLSFLIQATQLMGLAAVAQLLQNLLTFLPSVIAALIIFLLGGIVATFVGTLVTTLGLGAGLGYAARLGRLAQYLVSLFVVVLALGTLKIDTALLVTALTIAIAAFGLAIGLGLGLGARGIVAHILAGYYIRQRFPVGRLVALNETVRGAVSGVGGVNTVVTTADGEDVVVPNTVLLDAIVRTGRAGPPAPEAAAPGAPPA